MKDENLFTKLMAEFGRDANYWQMFREADAQGPEEVRATYARAAFTLCSSSDEFINLCATLDALAEYHAKTDVERARLYYFLWREADRWAAQVLTEKELAEYHKIDYVARISYY